MSVNGVNLMTEDEMWEAVQSNDESKDGLFYYCVKSTGIFCRPSCKSKLPLRKHVMFVRTKEEAIEAGYRPCKRCRSDLVTYVPQKEVAKKIKRIQDSSWNNTLRLRKELHELGYSSHRLNEIFIEEYGMSQAEYINQKKIKYAQNILCTTSVSIVDLSSDLGFNSLSSFYKFFKAQTGKTPALYRKENAHVELL